MDSEKAPLPQSGYVCVNVCVERKSGPPAHEICSANILVGEMCVRESDLGDL